MLPLNRSLVYNVVDLYHLYRGKALISKEKHQHEISPVFFLLFSIINPARNNDLLGRAHECNLILLKVMLHVISHL